MSSLTVGRALFGEFAPEAKVYSTSNDLIQYIRASGDRSHFHGYLISHQKVLASSKLHHIATTTRVLSVVVAIIIPDHDGSSVNAFIKSLSSSHWSVTTQQVTYSTIGDMVADSLSREFVEKYRIVRNCKNCTRNCTSCLVIKGTIK